MGIDSFYLSVLIISSWVEIPHAGDRDLTDSEQRSRFKTAKNLRANTGAGSAPGPSFPTPVCAQFCAYHQARLG